jgi:propanol-preferring alcohol dehydrogenase
MANMVKTAITHQFGEPLSIEEIPTPGVAPNQILVKIMVSGICHTDLYAINGNWFFTAFTLYTRA